jgi:DNA-directed RNA polymerase subunit RPC12/RpoP
MISDMVGKKMLCMGCLTENNQMRLDKKGRPYSICTCCGSRTFFRGDTSMQGWSILYEGIATALRRHDAVTARNIIAAVNAPAKEAVA